MHFEVALYKMRVAKIKKIKKAIFEIVPII